MSIQLDVPCTAQMHRRDPVTTLGHSSTHLAPIPLSHLRLVTTLTSTTEPVASIRGRLARGPCSAQGRLRSSLGSASIVEREMSVTHSVALLPVDASGRGGTGVSVLIGGAPAEKLA